MFGSAVGNSKDFSAKGRNVFVKVLKSKIHRAAVTDNNIDYVGSITIAADLMEAVGLREYEQVLVANLNNGTRHETYAQVGETGSGVICLNGAAARLACVGDRVIIMAFGLYKSDEPVAKPEIITLNEKNQIIR